MFNRQTKSVCCAILSVKRPCLISQHFKVLLNIYVDVWYIHNGFCLRRKCTISLYWCLVSADSSQSVEEVRKHDTVECHTLQWVRIHARQEGEIYKHVCMYVASAFQDRANCVHTLAPLTWYIILTMLAQFPLILMWNPNCSESPLSKFVFTYTLKCIKFKRIFIL